MRAAAVGRDRKMDEGIDLRANLGRHFLELDPVEPQQRFAAHLQLQIVPGGEERLRRDALGKIAGQQRGVVVAQILAEPAQPARQMRRHDTERQDAGDVAAAEPTDDDDWADAVPHADMALPGGQPVECLERGAVGDALEAAPFAFDRGQVAVDAQIKARHLAQPVAAARDRRWTVVDRRGFVSKRRQCRGASHCIH